MKPKLMTKIERKKRIKIILPYLKKHWKILDCACGDGWLANYLNENGYNCTGVDIQLLKQGENFVEVSADNMPFEDNSFDCIISIQTLEHIVCEKEFSRVLKKDGLLLVEVPRWDFPFRVLDRLNVIQAGIEQHVRVVNFHNFSPFSLRKWFATGCRLCKFGIFRNGK